MVTVFSDAWLDRREALAGGLPARTGASARLRHQVSGTPEGEVTWVDVYEDGRLVAVGRDAAAESDVTLVQTYADAVQIAAGELDVHAAFMQGRVKVVGDVGSLMAVLSVTQSDEHREAMAQLAAETA